MGALFGFTGPSDPELLEAMASSLRHRSSPGAALESERGPRCTLATMPPPYRHGGARLRPGVHSYGLETIAVAGLVTRGHLPVEGSSATEVAVRLRGAFVAAVSEGAKVHLIRDAAGRRTVYCARLDGRWVFGTEPKAIHRLPDFRAVLRPGAVAQYLTFSFIPGAQTMLEGLWEVPSGHIATLDPDLTEPVFVPYWLPEREPDEDDHSDDEVWITRFRRDFADAVEALRPPGAPVGVFLSGGIDSSIVTAQLAASGAAEVHTFALHFGSEYPNECAYAKSVADYWGTIHHEVLIRPREFIPRLRDVVWHLDEPIGDPVAMPNFELAARAAQMGFRFVFNGEGGDPLFGGPKNIPMMLGHWYGGERAPGFRERAYLASYRRAYEALDTLLTPEFRRTIDAERDLESVLRPFFEAERPRRFLDKLIAINTRLKGAHLILPKVERMLGAWGLTPLSPLFDERLLELTFRLPGHLKLSNGVEKMILKRAFAGRLPQAIIERPKSGMRVPVHAWFQGELKRYARRLLDRQRLAADGIFRPWAVEQLQRYDGSEGATRFGLRLWMLITFQMWKELVLDDTAG